MLYALQHNNTSAYICILHVKSHLVKVQLLKLQGRCRVKLQVGVQRAQGLGDPARQPFAGV
jgi:hypothetical protein